MPCTLPSCLYLLKKVPRKLNPHTQFTQKEKKKKNQQERADRRVREHARKREGSDPSWRKSGAGGGRLGLAVTGTTVS